MHNLIMMFQSAIAFTQTEPGRISATIIVLSLAITGVKFFQKRARSRCASDSEVARQRGNFVLAKNLLLLVSVIIVGEIWATKIAGVALSVAAVTGAILLVSKDFLINLLGTAVLAITRSYGVGDFIEINGISGCVVDTSMLNTTVVDTPWGNLITGSTVTIPHVLLLTHPVRNLTSTGRFVLKLLHVAVTPDSALSLEPLLLQAANETCADWVDQASAHLRMVGSRELVDLPSGIPKVIIDLTEPRHATLALRYACRPNDRINIEQSILRRYLDLKAIASASRA